MQDNRRREKELREEREQRKVVRIREQQAGQGVERPGAPFGRSEKSARSSSQLENRDNAVPRLYMRISQALRI